MPKALFKPGALKKFITKKKLPPRRFILPNNNAKVEILPKPIKSESDHKEYRVIRLENGLTALLISDLYSVKSDFIPPINLDNEPEVEEEDSDESETSEDAETEEEEGDAECAADDSDSDEEDEERMGSHSNEEDQDEKMAACALCVGVGSYSDPPNIQGLAHFVEHLLFMGSSKYPQENGFDSFVKNKGGSDNACTDCEVTNFHFEIPEEHLAEALDKFAHFFISPLMKQEAMQREREAVNSEFSLSIPVDSNRTDQLLSLCLPEGHPGRTFMWGDIRSLSAPIGPEDEELHKQAHEFRKRHYSAHRMTLAVQARLSLNMLEKYVTNIFSQIPTNWQPPDDFSEYQFSQETATPKFRSLYYVEPVGNKSELHLTWCMKSFLNDYKSKPHQYVSWIIGHEGVGSLLSYLRKKVWALDIYTGNSESGIDHTSVNCYFSISVVLTKAGLQNVDKVIESIFSYINLLRDECPNERIFKEIKEIEDINFKFEKELHPFDNVEGLAENMQMYPPEHYLTGEDLFYEYNPELINYVLNCMRPDKVNIMVFSKDHDPPIEYTDVEFWFGTKYVEKAISEESIKKWKKISPLPEFRLPEPNIFITDNFSLIPKPDDLVKALAILEKYKKNNEKEAEDDVNLSNNSSKHRKKPSKSKSLQNKKSVKDVKYTEEELESKKWACGVLKKYYDASPELVVDNKCMELWYKPDYKYGLPKAVIYICLMSANAGKTPKINCMEDLWGEILSQYLVDKLYPASMAGLGCFTYASDRGVVIKLGGFSQKLPILVDVIFEAISEHMNHLTEELFSALKDQLVKSYSNALIRPNKLNKLVRLSLLVSDNHNLVDKLSALKVLQFGEIKEFYKEYIRKMKVRVLVQGNMTKEQAVNISKIIQRNIQWEELLEEERHKIQVVEIPAGKWVCRLQSLNKHGVNSNITNYYQWGEYSLKKTAVLDLIMLLMEEPLFDQLRTKEQLGYSVFSLLRSTYGVLGFSVTVNTQANKYGADHIEERINAFLKSFKDELDNLSEKTFAQIKSALIKQKRCADLTLKEETIRHWSEITSLEYTFDRIHQEIECVRSLTLDDVRQHFNDYYDRENNEKFRLLSIQVIGNTKMENVEDDGKDMINEIKKLDHTFLKDENPHNRFISSIKDFQQNLKVFPELCRPLKNK